MQVKHPIDKAPITTTIPRCPVCGSSRLKPYHTVTERDSEGAVAWKQQHVRCLKCDERRILIAE